MVMAIKPEHCWITRDWIRMKENDMSREVYRVAESLSKTFIQRWDLFPEQEAHGRYRCHHEPLTMDHIVGHLKGEITLGAYVLDQHNQTRYVVLDADDETEFEPLCGLASKIPSYLETSRRGGHLWVFFEESIFGNTARKFGKGLLDEMAVDMEIFPKQGASEGPGSLIRLPFGIHRKTGERYPFIRPDGRRLGKWTEQMEMLMNPETIRMDQVEKYLQSKECTRRKESIPTEKLWDQVKRKTPVIDFIRGFVQLKETGNIAVGKCPFHDDEHPSFSVNIEENYWYCFAGCGGGSIIDFWMKWRDCDFNTSTQELAAIYGLENE
jgi:hypothetical protein